MSTVFQEIEKLGREIVDEWFLKKFESHLYSRSHDCPSAFLNGGFMFFAFKSNYNQFPVIISNIDTTLSLPVFVGANNDIYRCTFDNIDDLVNKVKNYYYSLLCSNDNIFKFINEELKDLNTPDEIREVLFLYTIGHFNTFAIEFESWNLLPISDIHD